jgi:signal transduction histidine kinase
VADTGIGIPAERQEEIFEPLHQLDGSPTRRYGGTGLGLALVRLILTAHGSQVTVQSEPGKGTTLSFLLPAADQAA